MTKFEDRQIQIAAKEASRFDANPFETGLEDSAEGIRRLRKWFVGVLGTLFIGIGGWSVLAQIDSAVVSEGTITVRSSAQAVQHLEGGVIGAVLVGEGDEVAQGQVLVRLDGAQVSAELAILERQRVDFAVERARLVAERDGLTNIEQPDLPNVPIELTSALRTGLALQQTLLTARMSAKESRISQLSQRLNQVENEVAGLERLRAARVEEKARIGEELEALETLDAKRLIAKPRLRAVQREAARIEGDIGDIDARIASAQSQTVETRLRIEEIERGARSEVLDRLAAVDAQIAETEERRAAALDRQTRLEIRAPRAGIVHELIANTIGGVAAPRETLMSIIPLDDPLIVSARINVTEIDQVHVGQRATVQVSAFDQRTSPELEGAVTGVSPDQIEDERTGQRYYSVKVALNDGETEKLGGQRLTPGMPATVLIRGEARAVITYLTQPLTDQIALAFRE